MNRKAIGKYIKNLNLGLIASFTAGAAGDNTEATSAVIDRTNYDSCVLSLGFSTALTTAKKLTNLLKIQTSDDNSTWDTAVTLYAAHDLATATTATGIKEYDIDLTPYKQYVKFLYTLDLTHTGTDTCVGYTNITLGGSNTLPV